MHADDFLQDMPFFFIMPAVLGDAFNAKNLLEFISARADNNIFACYAAASARCLFNTTSLMICIHY